MHHRVALADTLERLRRAPLAAGLVALTLGVAIALPALLYSGVSALQDLAREWDAQVRVNVFVEVPDDGAREALLDTLETSEEIERVEFQDADASLAEFVRAMGFEDAEGAGFGILGEDPLPAVALVTPAPDVRAPARLRALAARLERLPGVVGVQLDLDWVERLLATLRAVERLALGVGGLLGLGVLLAVGGLTRATLDARRQELVVLRLVGATDAFVRRPFLYGGALQGALGGLVACLLVAVLAALLGAPLAALAASYGLGETPAPPLGRLLIVLPVAGAGLGWLGARLALAHRLALPEP
jgi:cell division transport system permease protein